MAEHRTDDRHEEVKPRTAVEREEAWSPTAVEHPHGEEHQHQAKGQRIAILKHRMCEKSKAITGNEPQHILFL